MEKEQVQVPATTRPVPQNWFVDGLRAVLRVLSEAICYHYWDKGEPLSQDPREQGVNRFTCLKCGTVKVRRWNWGIEENVRKFIG